MRKKYFMVMFFILMIVGFMDVDAEAAEKDKVLVKQYIIEHYSMEYKIVYVKRGALSAKKLRRRKRKHIIYVEKWISISRGRYGFTRDGEKIYYNKKIKKGKKVRSYFLYNPDTRYIDDVIVVIDNGKIR